MSTTSTSPRTAPRPPAFTLLELLLVIVVIAILASLLLPVIAKAQRRGRATQCVNHLKQLAIAFHSFAHNHDSRFPMQVSTNAGGSMEFLRYTTNLPGDFEFAFRHFQVLSNELGNPKLLVCPLDKRNPAGQFKLLQSENVSYFAGRHADYHRPDSVLAGDRNLTVVNPSSGIVTGPAASPQVAWAADLHEHKGNLLFADGRVEQLTTAGLQAAVSRSSVPASAPSRAPASSNPAPGANGTANGSSGGSGRGTGSSRRTVATPSGGALEKLEAFFNGQPGPQPPPSRASSVSMSLSNDFRSKGTSAPPGALTNRSSPASTNLPPPAQADVPPGVSLPEEAARQATVSAHRVTHWLLLLLLAIIIAMGVQHHSRKKARKRAVQQEGA